MTRPEKTAVSYVIHISYIIISFLHELYKICKLPYVFSERNAELQAHTYVQVTRLESNMVAYNAYIGLNGKPAILLAYWG